MRSSSLPKSEVRAVIAAWESGAMTDDEMHVWVTNNYFPAHQAVAPGEPDQVALAIGIVLTEFECAQPPYQFSRAAAVHALALIDADDQAFDDRKRAYFDSLRVAHGP
jgi:hypothetical protein